MAEPITVAAIGGVIVSALKLVGKELFKQAKRIILTFWENKYVLILASTCGGLFFYGLNILNSWFGFPSLLNIALHGIFHLSNLAWVISNWKSAPTDNSSSSSEPRVNIS